MRVLFQQRSWIETRADHDVDEEEVVQTFTSWERYMDYTCDMPRAHTPCSQVAEQKHLCNFMEFKDRPAQGSSAQARLLLLVPVRQQSSYIRTFRLSFLLRNIRIETNETVNPHFVSFAANCSLTTVHWNNVFGKVANTTSYNPTNPCQPKKVLISYAPPPEKSRFITKIRRSLS